MIPAKKAMRIVAAIDDSHVTVIHGDEIHEDEMVPVFDGCGRNVFTLYDRAGKQVEGATYIGSDLYLSERSFGLGLVLFVNGRRHCDLDDPSRMVV